MEQIWYAKKEIAFDRWKNSGYADFAAYNEYMKYFSLIQKV